MPRKPPGPFGQNSERFFEAVRCARAAERLVVLPEDDEISPWEIRLPEDPEDLNELYDPIRHFRLWNRES